MFDWERFRSRPAASSEEALGSKRRAVTDPQPRKLAESLLRGVVHRRDARCRAHPVEFTTSPPLSSLPEQATNLLSQLHALSAAELVSCIGFIARTIALSTQNHAAILVCTTQICICARLLSVGGQPELEDIAELCKLLHDRAARSVVNPAGVPANGNKI